MKPSLRRANVKWFSDKQKPKHRAARSTPLQKVGLRLHDLARLFRSRYGVVLPDDDSGREDAETAINHMANLTRPRRHIANWISLWAPWMPAGELQDMVGLALANPHYWTADQLAWRLKLTAQERRMLGITTIGAIDENKAARLKRRRNLERERKARQRRAKGAKPRKDYESQSTAQAMPWVTEGISRATWYRRNTSRETH